MNSRRLIEVVSVVIMVLGVALLVSQHALGGATLISGSFLFLMARTYPRSAANTGTVIYALSFTIFYRAGTEKMTLGGAALVAFVVAAGMICKFWEGTISFQKPKQSA
jgi:hypothetical protein